MANLVRDQYSRKDGFMRGSQYQAQNITIGGQFGWAPSISNIIQSTPYTQSRAFPYLLQYPKAFDLFPKDIRDELVAMLKALMEKNSKTITGLRRTISTEWVGTELGGGGEKQEDIANVTREASAPTHTWDEGDGRPVQNYFEWIIESLGMNHQSKFPDIVCEGFPITHLLGDMTKFVMLYVEPDKSGLYCVDAYLCANMFPKSAGDRESESDVSQGRKLREIVIEFTAITQHGYGVLALGQQMLNLIKRNGANPNYVPAAVDEIDANIKAQATGFADQVAQMGKNRINT